MGDYTEHLISMAGGDGEPGRPDLVATGPTRCAASQAPMTWDGSRWVHAPGLCADPGHEIDLDAIQARVDDALTHESLTASDYAEMAWASARDVPALLAVVRSQQAKIERVEALASAWEARGESDMAFSKDIIDENISIAILTDGAGMVENARHIRAAITATEGAE